jgi:hypothetical protein
MLETLGGGTLHDKFELDGGLTFFLDVLSI